MAGRWGSVTERSGPEPQGFRQHVSGRQGRGVKRGLGRGKREKIALPSTSGCSSSPWKSLSRKTSTMPSSTRPIGAAFVETVMMSEIPLASASSMNLCGVYRSGSDVAEPQQEQEQEQARRAGGLRSGVALEQA